MIIDNFCFLKMVITKATIEHTVPTKLKISRVLIMEYVENGLIIQKLFCV